MADTETITNNSEQGDKPINVVEETVVSPMQDKSSPPPDPIARTSVPSGTSSGELTPEVGTPEFSSQGSLIANAQDSLKASNSIAERTVSGENTNPNARYEASLASSGMLRGDLESKLSGDELEPNGQQPVSRDQSQMSAPDIAVIDGDCAFKLDSSLIRQEYIFKETSRNERTGRKIQFVDQASEPQPLTITKFSDTLHYAPTLRTDIPGALGHGLVEVKPSRGCCSIS